METLAIHALAIETLAIHALAIETLAIHALAIETLAIHALAIDTFNGFCSKLDIPVSLDTKCTFGGVSRDSVEILIKMHRNQYKIENLTILTPPPPPEKELRLVQTRNALLVDFHIKVLKMHRNRYKME